MHTQNLRGSFLWDLLFEWHTPPDPECFMINVNSANEDSVIIV